MKKKLVHKMVKKYAVMTGEEVEEIAVHRGITCDGCDVSPITGVRYKCTECRDFDFCENCEKSVKHNPDHIFKKIKKPIRRHHGHGHCWRKGQNEQPQQPPQEGQVHYRVRCDGCGTGPILGIRYKCAVCPNFDFCEKCKATVVHPKEHSFNEITKPVDRSQCWKDIREQRCNFFKNAFNMFNQNKPKETVEEKKPEEVTGYDFLVKELKETYQLQQLDDKLILEALKKANGDVEQAMTILFS